jgi:hypothetical protein
MCKAQYARIGRATLSLIALFIIAASKPVSAQTTVYVMGGGSSASDMAVVSALTGAGFNVTLGVETPNWNGTQANLGDYGAVVMLNNYNWRGKMTEAGALAIQQYVMAGGGVITGEWLTYNAQWSPILAELLPTTYVGFTDSESTTTTYTQVTANPILNDGLPSSFTFTKGYAEGTEGRLNAKAGATTFYQSSATGLAGLAGWNYGAGRVLSFSSILTGVDVDNPNLDRLLGNAVTWADGNSTPTHAPEGGSLAMLAGGALPIGLYFRRAKLRRR